jgi:glycosyltransferase involved in cell wall biosynthesis
MKVLHIVGNEIEESNGIGRLLPEMIEMQNKYSDSLSCSLLCINGKYESNNFKVYKLNELTDLVIDQFDLFIFHGIYFYSYIKLSKRILSRNKIYFVKPHSSLIHSAQKKSAIKKMLGNLICFKSFIKSANAVIFINADEAKNSLQWNRNYFLEGNGLASNQHVLQKTKITVKPYKFVYMSRIDFSHKGTDILLDALELLKEKYKITNFNLSIYGKGNEKEVSKLIYRIGKLGFPDVSFNGPIFGQEKNNMLLSKDIFILTSRYEGFPMAILEALDSGLPCLVTRGVNMSSIINNYHVGWECETAVESVAALILSVMKMDSNLIEEASDLARKYVIKEHDWPSLVNHSEATYSALSTK